MASVPIKRLARILSAAGLCVALSAPAGAAASGGHWLRVGDAQSFLRLDPGNYPEGIAVGKRGIVYLGNRRDDGEHFISEILAIARDGQSRRSPNSPSSSATATRATTACSASPSIREEPSTPPWCRPTPPCTASGGSRATARGARACRAPSG